MTREQLSAAEGNVLQASVCATVLTHNSPDTLARCLTAIRAQATLPDEIIVVDNASEPPVRSFAFAKVVRSAVNTGPAGGHNRAVKEFLATDHDFIWMMDDDIEPHERCLELLLEEQGRRKGLVRPVAISSKGESSAPGWWGVLIAREVVEEVGLPRADLFWWIEDTEYLQHRIGRSRFGDRVCRQAFVNHLEARDRGIGSTPAWKYYYQSRNGIWYRTRVHWGPPLHGLKRLFRSIVGPPYRIARFERQARVRKLSRHLQGVLDGFRGRLGKRAFP